MFAIYTIGPQIMGAFGLGQGREAILGEIVIGMFFMVGCIPAMFWAAEKSLLGVKPRLPA
jgi:MFS transporter, putative metabolite transport protein